MIYATVNQNFQYLSTLVLETHTRGVASGLIMLKPAKKWRIMVTLLFR